MSFLKWQRPHEITFTLKLKSKERKLLFSASAKMLEYLEQFTHKGLVGDEVVLAIEESGPKPTGSKPKGGLWILRR